MEKSVDQFNESIDESTGLLRLLAIVDGGIDLSGRERLPIAPRVLCTEFPFTVDE
jgi:hypothetical protein